MTTFRAPGHRVIINGVARTALDVQAATGERSFVATATIALLAGEGVPTPGQEVRAEVAKDGASYRPIFHGEIEDDGVQLAPWGLTISCSGFLGRAQRATGHQDTTAPPIVGGTETDPTGDPVVYPQYYATDKTDQAIVAELLALCGITEVAIGGRGLVLGTIEPVQLGYAEAPWRLIADIDRLTGYRTYDAPDGTVVRAPSSTLPSTTTAFAYREGFEIVSADRRRSRRETRNLITITGLDQLGSTSIPFTPVATVYADAPLDPATGRPIISDPPKYQSEPWGTPLAETANVCLDYATRRLAELNRLSLGVQFAPAGGEPGLRPGMTISLESGRLGVGSFICHVEQVQQRSGGREGVQTIAGVVAFTGQTGYNPNQPPVPLIALTVDQELLADGSTLTIVQADGSASYDPDGDVVSYVWSGSTAPAGVGAEGKTATYVYTGDPTGQTIALTVTDDKGLTASKTRTFSLTAQPVLIRDLYSAEATRLQVSRQNAWLDVTAGGAAIAAVGVCEISENAPYTFAWTASGALYKVAEDNTAELVPDVAGVTACWITETLTGVQPKGRVWAGTSGGQVWFSQADGEPGTWTRLADVGSAAAIGAIQESPTQDGDVYALSKNVLYHSYDRAATWAALRTHPNTALIGSRIASGFAKLFAAFKGGGGDDAGVARVVERNNASIGDFPSGDKPVSAVGLTYALLKDMGYALDIDSAGTTGRAWRAAWDTTSFNWERRTYVTGTLGLPAHMIRDGRVELVYGTSAAKVWKALDDLGTYYILKNLTSPVAGKMIGYGKLRARANPPATLVASAFDPGGAGAAAHKLIARDPATGRWAIRSSHPYTDISRAWDRVLVHITGDVYLTFAIFQDGAGWYTPGASSVNAHRSTDGARTWTALATTGVLSACVAADGAVWAVTDDGTKVRKSTDQGATWADMGVALTTGGTGGTFGGLTLNRYTGIAAHPSDANRLALRQHSGVTTTSTAFASKADVGPGDHNQIFPLGYGLARTSSSATIWKVVLLGGDPAQAPFARAQEGDATASGLANADTNQLAQLIEAQGALVAVDREVGSTIWRSTDDGVTWATIATDDTASVAADIPAQLLIAAGATWRGAPLGAPTTWQRIDATMAGDIGALYSAHVMGVTV